MTRLEAEKIADRVNKETDDAARIKEMSGAYLPENTFSVVRVDTITGDRIYRDPANDYYDFDEANMLLDAETKDRSK